MEQDAERTRSVNVVACLIVYEKDKEHKKLSRLFDSTEKAGTTGYVIALDSKSVPGTGEWLAKTLGSKATVFEHKWPDHFGQARQKTLDALPPCDWWYWIDADDVLEMSSGKTIPEVLSGVDPRAHVIFCDYDYQKDQYGNVQTRICRGRFYRSGFKWEWRNRIHEDVYPPEGMEFGRELGIQRVEDFLWVHDLDDRDNADTRNMRLLEIAIAEEPDNPRNYYYLGNQNFASKRFTKAAEAYEQYVQLSGWDEEKWAAMIHAAISYRALGKFEEAISADTRAMHYRPDWADSYFGLGETYTRLEQWEKARYWGEEGIKKVASGEGIPDPTILVNYNAYAHNPYRWLAVVYFNLGDNDSALRALKQAASARPEEELLRQIDHLEWAMGRERITKAGLDLAAGLLRRNEPIKARAILDNLPAGTGEQFPGIHMAKKDVDSRLAHLYDRTKYRNLYVADAESVDPFEAIEHIHELPRFRWLLRRLKAMGAKRVFEVGIGNGAEGIYLAQNGIEVVGIDVDPRRVREANAAAVKAGFLKKKFLKEAGVRLPFISKESKVQFHAIALEDIDSIEARLTDGERVKVRDLGPFDAVVATELVEHVLDPEKTLAICESISPRVFLTTPDGSWDGPQTRNPGHVRAWSQMELARMIVPRGRIVDLHKVTMGEHQANLACEYIAGQEVTPGLFITIWCFDTGQRWSPDSLHEGGIGGSETAVIRVAEELAKKGHLVTVYAEAEGVWNGVRYYKTEDFRPSPCNVFVSWRSVGPIAEMKGLAQHRFIWSHDIHFGPASPEQLEGVKVLALSDWHKGFLESQYPSAEVVRSGNGIDPTRFDGEVKRKKHRLIYAQSPDRGLNVVLRMFPKIRERFPDATLDVFYGFDLTKQRHPEFTEAVLEMAEQPGVTLHGRVDQDRLAREYLASDALLYPAQMPDGESFPETYCISVVEAQAAGCVPITPSHAALLETNAHGIQAPDLLASLTAFWQMPKHRQDEIRRIGREWALQQTWERVADGWLSATQEQTKEK